MAFAQLTYRESLRDIETCLSVHASKLYPMGFRQPVRRSTLADANERRDWRIHAALAQRLITQARTLYVDEELGLDLTNTVYALDSTTIALCLSVFPWAHFRSTKARRWHTRSTTGPTPGLTTFMPFTCRSDRLTSQVDQGLEIGQDAGRFANNQPIEFIRFLTGH